MPSPWGSAGAVAAVLLAACSGGGGGGCGVVEQITEPLGNFHVLTPEAVDYRNSPPTAGPHFGGQPPRDGVYDEPLDEIRQVLALELGAVVVQYDDTVAPDAVERLEALAEREQVIVTPAPGVIDGDNHVAFTAWERRQLCAEADAAVVGEAEAFIDEFVGQGPGEQAPAPGSLGETG